MVPLLLLAECQFDVAFKRQYRIRPLYKNEYDVNGYFDFASKMYATK